MRSSIYVRGIGGRDCGTSNVQAMRFEVKKHVTVERRNVLGIPVETRTFYTIDKVCLYVFRFAIKFESPCRITEPSGILKWERAYVKYTTPEYATQFSDYVTAMNVLRDMLQNPDKYLI